jgi:RHS repeat-associated protein
MQLIKSPESPGNPGRYRTTATYAYDGDGLRMSKTVSGITSRFSWDVAEGLPLLLVDGTTSYVYGPSGLPLEQVGPSGTLYYYQDQLGDTRALATSAGTVTATYTYDSYGRLTGSTGSAPNPFGYAGQYKDAESGLIYLRARYYDPTTGQFLSRDPLVAITQSAYGYAADNPLDATDPSGLFCLLGHVHGNKGPCRGTNVTTDLKVAAVVLGATALVVATGGAALAALPVTGATLGIGSLEVGFTAATLAEASTYLSVASTLATAGTAGIDCSRKRDMNCVADVAEAISGGVSTGLSGVAGLEHPLMGFLANAMGLGFDLLSFGNFDKSSGHQRQPKPVGALGGAC